MTALLEIQTEEQVLLLLQMMCERKFGSDDDLARLSLPLNSVLKKILSQLQNDQQEKFDMYREQAVLAYQKDSSFHDWLKRQSSEKKASVIEDYFLPIKALRAFDADSIEEVSNAYRY